MDHFPVAVHPFDLKSSFNLKPPLICSSACCGEIRKQISFILSVTLSRAQQAVMEVFSWTDVLNVTGGVGPPTPSHTAKHMNTLQIKDAPSNCRPAAPC